MQVIDSGDDREFTPYQVYLIRLWPTRREGVEDYRVSLQDVATGDHREFPTLNQFVVFIQGHKGANNSNTFRLP
ncbi:MAG: hypothetical protein PVH65_00785 [Chloroflexota bacterium]|jgi:hypothetical protein